jgi:hypothetical protein
MKRIATRYTPERSMDPPEGMREHKQTRPENVRVKLGVYGMLHFQGTSIESYDLDPRSLPQRHEREHLSTEYGGVFTVNFGKPRKFRVQAEYDEMNQEPVDFASKPLDRSGLVEDLFWLWSTERPA